MVPGAESKKRFALLLQLNPKFGENTKNALKAHFTDGWNIELVCCAFDIQQPNLVRSIKKLNETNDIVEQIKHLDLYHLSDLKEANDSHTGPTAA
jgi:predicted transcriptional regulator